MVECRTCRGRYQALLPDGTEYYHVCPPLSDAEIAAALGLPLDDALRTPAQRAQLAAAPRGRAGARDENVDPVKDQAVRDPSGERRAGTTRELVQKAAGAGVTRV